MTHNVNMSLTPLLSSGLPGSRRYGCCSILLPSKLLHKPQDCQAFGRAIEVAVGAAGRTGIRRARGCKVLIDGMAWKATAEFNICAVPLRSHIRAVRRGQRDI